MAHQASRRAGAPPLDFYATLFEELDPERLRRTFLRLLLETQQTDRGSIWMRRDDEIVCVEAAGHQSERIRGMTIPAGQHSIAGWVMDTGEMTIAEPARDERHFREVEEGLDVKSSLILGFPLVLRSGEVYGALEIIDTSAGGDRLKLDPDYLELLRALVSLGSAALGNALRFSEYREESARLRSELDAASGPGPIVGRSPALVRALELVGDYARTDFPVLVTGESGTGKELFARAIHARSPRCQGPLLVQNMSAIPENLLESELFGHVKGAFTGADRDRKGLFEEAHGGTVFLDEVGDMPPGLQAKILRVLQSGEIKPLGANAARSVDVRIVAATNRDLTEAVAAREFREDLYYRLAVLPLHIPPLRQRAEDVPDLLDYFMRRESIRLSIAPRPFTHEALHTLQGWGWPGNVRELENLVKLVLATSRGDAVERDDLPVHLRASGAGAPAVGGGSGAFEGRTWEEMERGYARWLLEETGFNISRAARLAGLSRSTFDSRLRRLGIERGG